MSLLQQSFFQMGYRPSEVATLFASYVPDRGLTVIDAKTMREFCRHHGATPYSYPYVLRAARAANIIRKLHDRSWMVTLP